MERLILDDFLPFRLSVASNRVSGVIAQAYQAMFGLSIPEWRVIAVLAEYRGMTQAELVGRTRMDKMTVSRAVRPLVDRGLIARSPHDADGRSHRLQLSDEGRRLYDAIVPATRAMEAQVLASFAPGEVAALKSALRRLEDAAAQIAPAAGGGTD